MLVVYKGPEEAVVLADERVFDIIFPGVPVEVPEDTGALLLEQVDMWTTPDATSKPRSSTKPSVPADTTQGE